jgi:hypothetical protein
MKPRWNITCRTVHAGLLVHQYDNSCKTEQLRQRTTEFIDSFHRPVFYITENTLRKLYMFPSSGEGGEDTNSVGPLRKSKSQLLLPLSTGDENRSSFRNVVVSILRNTGRWENSKIPVNLCHTSSSEPFRIYLKQLRFAKIRINPALVHQTIIKLVINLFIFERHVLIRPYHTQHAESQKYSQASNRIQSNEI